MKISLLTTREVFGIKECMTNPPIVRQNTVVCNMSGSKVYFMAFKDFQERL